VSERLFAPLWNPQQGHQAFAQAWTFAKNLLMAGHRLTLEVRPISKSREQEEKYHAIFGEVASQAEHLGSKWDAEAWKRFLLDAFAKETGRSRGKIVPNLTGDGVVEVGLQSRKFSKQDASEFVEWLQAWCAERGVELRQ
jgi:hypothetical protein